MNTLKKLICIILISMQAPFAWSQDCTAHFEAEAGPDIDVCEGGTVVFGSTMGGDATEAVWKGGKGFFEPNRNTLNAEYTPSEDETGTTVVLTLEASNHKFSSCPAAKSSIKLTVNSIVVVNAGDDIRVCAGNTVHLRGAVTQGKAKSTAWITNGSGTFDDVHRLDAIYTPSKDDIEKAALSIMLTAEPFGVCLPDSNTLIVMIDAVPMVTITPDIYVENLNPINLTARIVGGSGEIQWSSSGTGTFENPGRKDAVYNPSAADMKNGSINLSVFVSSINGRCNSKKQAKLHFAGK